MCGKTGGGPFLILGKSQNPPQTLRSRNTMPELPSPIVPFGGGCLGKEPFPKGSNMRAGSKPRCVGYLSDFDDFVVFYPATVIFYRRVIVRIEPPSQYLHTGRLEFVRIKHVPFHFLVLTSVVLGYGCFYYLFFEWLSNRRAKSVRI
jgi:hypothetical protein